jgi:excisionase family DNA binding protein
MTLATAADYLDVSERTIRRLVDDGKLEEHRLPLGPKRQPTRVSRDQLDQLVADEELDDEAPREVRGLRRLRDALDEAD